MERVDEAMPVEYQQIGEGTRRRGSWSIHDRRGPIYMPQTRPADASCVTSLLIGSQQGAGVVTTPHQSKITG